MDQKAKRQNMNSDFTENWDAKQEMYETPNKGIILEPRSLWIKEWLIGHRVSLFRVGSKKEVWIRGLHRHQWL